MEMDSWRDRRDSEDYESPLFLRVGKYMNES